MNARAAQTIAAIAPPLPLTGSLRTIRLMTKVGDAFVICEQSKFVYMSRSVEIDLAYDVTEVIS
jgi:hypothetical protein